MDPQSDGVDIRRIGQPLPPVAGVWASAIRVVNLRTLGNEEDVSLLNKMSHPATTHCIELPDNTSAVSICATKFHDKDDDLYVLVGVVHSLKYHPRSHKGGSILTFKAVDIDTKGVFEKETNKLVCYLDEFSNISENDYVRQGYEIRNTKALRLQYLHRTPVEDIPFALSSFSGRVLAGIGKTLRLYDLGKRKLLRKCERGGFPTLIQSIQVSSDRAYVCDAAESVHFVKYRKSENVLVTFADDTVPRHMTALLPLDEDTVCGADKFGNLFVLRLPEDATDDAVSASGPRLAWDASTGGLGGAPNKLVQIAQYYVGDVITSLQKVAFTGTHECILYGTATGGIGALLPLLSKAEVDFFTHLEIYLRNEDISLLGRDHLAFRSTFLPAKDVIDGDLCECFASSISGEKQKTIATDLDRTAPEVLRKIEDMRNRII